MVWPKLKGNCNTNNIFYFYEITLDKILKFNGEKRIDSKLSHKTVIHNNRDSNTWYFPNFKFTFEVDVHSQRYNSCEIVPGLRCFIYRIGLTW